MNAEQFLSGEYNRGYTNAILDVTSMLASVEQDVRLHEKRFTPKMMQEALSLFLANREKARERKPGFIRWNVQKNKLEWFDGTV